MRLVLAALLLLPFAAEARVLEVGPGKDFKQPSDAITAAKSGDVVRIAPGEYFDCATVRAGNIVIEGVGDAASVVITDKSCGGKGLLITTGNGVTVRNLTLTRSRVPDNNGAGIRNEAPDLTVEGVRFINNQNGILSTPQEGGKLLIRDSVFERNGGCREGGGGCAHGIYVSTGSNVVIENSTFLGTKEGHHIKSRAPRNEITNCTIKDGPTGTASYLIDISNGGTLIVKNSTLEKGPEAENHSAAIIIGAEGVTQPTREIRVENNTFRNDGGWGTFFVNNLTATEAELVGNRISGRVKPLNGDGTVR